MKKLIPLVTLGLLAVMMGCPGAGRTSTQGGTGLNITNELSTTRMQPGGTIILRTTISNNWDNELKNATAKLTKSYGDRLIVEPAGDYDIGSILDNPNATAKAQWSLSVSNQAISGEKFENIVRVCFNYTQSAWHEISLINSFDVKSIPKKGGDSGPLAITFSGLSEPYVYNTQIKSKIPLSISIKNNYAGYIGTIDMPKGDVPNITKITMKIYDGGASWKLDANGSPVPNSTETNFKVIDSYNNPQKLNCNNNSWDNTSKFYNCNITNLPTFGETFLGTRLEIVQLHEEQLLEKVEVTVDYTYCVESSQFVLEVFQPGGV